MKKSLLFIAGTMLSCNAYCGLYFGASVGQVDSGDSGSASDLDYFIYTNISSEKSDTKDTGYSAYFGYEAVLKDLSIGLEAGLIEFGDNSLSAEGQDFLPGGDGKRSVDINADADATILALRLSRSFENEFNVFGKFGVSAWKVSAELSGEVYNALGAQVGSTSDSASDSGTDPFFGVGIGYKFIRIGFDRYKIGDSDTDYLYVGAQF